METGASESGFSLTEKIIKQEIKKKTADPVSRMQSIVSILPLRASKTSVLIRLLFNVLDC